MSNPLAIAAVTATLRNLIAHGVGDLPNQNVTTKPLDKAGTDNNGTDQINLFLYQAVINGAWRNMDMPRHTSPGETGHPPLPLNLYYLLTAYGQGDDETRSHQWLGQAMAALHDHPLLGAQEIKDALQANDLHEQIERIRITPQPLSLDEMSKLWTAFQSQYRISVAYRAEVVLIESTLPARTPLPVLTRGKDDIGVAVQPDLLPPYPTITAVSPDVQPPGSESGVVLGESLIVEGFNLDGTNISIQVVHPRVPVLPGLAPVGTTTSREIKVTIPDQPQTFAAGICTLSVKVTRPDDTFERVSNELPFALVPKILATPPMKAVRNGNQITITLKCSPAVLPDQRVALLVGGDEILADARPGKADSLKFTAKNIPAGKFIPGDYFVRLRVDGVDSLLIDRSVQPPVFKASQKLTIP